MTQDEIDNNIMESDLYYIFEDNFGTHSQDPDIDSAFIGDLIQYFERRLFEIDNYIDGKQKGYPVSIARETNKEVDLSDIYSVNLGDIQKIQQISNMFTDAKKNMGKNCPW
mgnify:FL=1